MPRGHRGSSRGGVFGHLDALYALAFLSSGNAAGAQQSVIDSFRALCADRVASVACPSVLWRRLADHVHLTSEAEEPQPDGSWAPFRAAALPWHQREAIALLLGGRGQRDAARLLGVSIHGFRSYVHFGLKAVHASILAGPDSVDVLGTGDDRFLEVD